MTARLLLVALCSAALSLTAACGPAREATPAAPAAEAIVRASQSGPVTAEVSLSPARPTLGDTLRLTLKVTAEKGVEVHMPAFGDALGRFSITAFTPRSVTLAGGSTLASQEYQLEAPMSGKQKIPSLLVEFVDRRAGAQRPDAGTSEASELLTDEIGVDVASVTDGDEKGGELTAPLGPLDEHEGAGRRARWPLAVAGAAVLALLAIAALVLVRRRRRSAAPRDALEEALARLSTLERRGLPAPDAPKETMDGWYVEVSAIVRRYLEDRYGLRAPELTTEEFLARAGDSTALAPTQRSVLRSFLERCDRVKFAAYRPPESESCEVIAGARRFLEETRPSVDPRRDRPDGQPPIQPDRDAARHPA